MLPRASIAGIVAALLVGLPIFADSAFAQADWTLSKTPSPTTYANVGDVISYTYVITNNGGGDGDVFSFTDDKIPVVDCPSTDVPPAGLTCTGQYAITLADLTAGSVTNNAEVVGDSCGDGCDITVTAQATITLDPQPSWTLAKTVDPPTFNGPDEDVTYSYLLVNTGNTAISTIALNDDKIGAVACPATTLAIGADMTCTATYTTTEADVVAGEVTNIATATGTPAFGSLAPVSDSAQITLAAQPDWTLVKTANPTTYGGEGEAITYSYLLTNTGNVAISAISLTDDKIATVNCPATALAVGADMTCTATYTTTIGDVGAGSVTNTATATGTPAFGSLAPVTDSAQITLAAQPDWTLAKTANPTTYGGDGEAIVYTYVLTNTGNAAITAIALTDDRIGAVTCPATALAIGADMTCTATYTTTIGDVDAGSITNVATAAGTPAFGSLAPVSAQATIIFVGPAAGSITIVKSAAGGDDTFSFTSTVPGGASFSLATTGGTASRAFGNVAPGSYTFTEVNLPTDWSLATLACTGDTGGTPTTVDLANQRVIVGLDGGEAITCTFGNIVGDQTSNDIAAFLKHRLSFLAEGPDRIRFFRRMPGALWGNSGGSTGGAVGGSSGPFAITGSSSDSAMEMSVATGLADLSQTFAQANGTLLPTPTFDVWLEVHYSAFEDEAGGTSSDGHFGVAYLGVDYLVTPSILVGALGQFDWGAEDSDAGASAEGIGFMAGPYLSARLTENLFFTSRAAYGISENSIDPFGLYEDEFSTDRWLASAELTGNWAFGNWRFTPGAKVTYLEEDQHNYTDSREILIPSQTVSLGEVTFGPEIAYRMMAGDNWILEPHVALTGLWEFDGDDGIIAGLVASENDLRARVKAGILAESVGGANFRIVGTFDGLGGGEYDAFGAQAWLSIPLR